MRVNYCLPIIKANTGEVLTAIKDNLADYEYFEVWLDYLDKIEADFLSQLTQLLAERLILVFRRQKLGRMKMATEQRLQVIESVKDTSAMIDLDIDAQTTELQYITQQKLPVKTIASYHNYQQTPNSVQLRSIIAKMREYRPAIYKLATQCNAPDDALRLLEFLLELKATGLKVITLGMGKHGTATRIFGSLWGNEMAFAPKLATEQSAPGQLTRQQLATIFKQLGY